MLCSILYRVVILVFSSRLGCPIIVLVTVLLQILVPWNNYFCKIVLTVSGFFLVFLYYFECVGPMLPWHIIILDGPTMYMHCFDVGRVFI